METDLRVGQLVVISCNSQGVSMLIYGDEAFTSSKEIRLFLDEYLVGILVERVTTRGTGGPFWKILTMCGIAHIWDCDLGEDDLSIRVLDEPIGSWLGENCTYNEAEGKHKLKNGLLAIGLYTSVGRTVP